MQSGLAPERLELEITESVLLQKSAGNLTMLHQFKSFGISVVLDDFGTGYSSLSYLRMFPFDKIKIDRSFVSELSNRADCAAIVCAITGLGRGLNIMTTAEGVETEEQLDLLRAAGVDQLQGYLLSRPKPAAELGFAKGRAVEAA
jgi:EAL domain-containing protein (putative c-di-GMP-specific phosphodiesterase class I)